VEVTDNNEQNDQSNSQNILNNFLIVKSLLPRKRLAVKKATNPISHTIYLATKEIDREIDNWE